MRLNGNEITIVRGESFSIDRTIVNRDGSPYIISNRLRNPHILITVADNAFLSKASKVYKYFLSLADAPLFTVTNPVDIKKTSQDGNVEEFPNDLTLHYSHKYWLFEDEVFDASPQQGLPGPEYGKPHTMYLNGERFSTARCWGLNAIEFSRPSATIGLDIFKCIENNGSEWGFDELSMLQSGEVSVEVNNDELHFIDVYEDDDIIAIAPNDAIFYLDKDGSIQYKYWVPLSETEGSTGKWLDYKFRFVKTFNSTVTNQWEPKTYYYSIELVSGEDPENGLYDDVSVILPASKLNVLSNLKGGLR
jgi:hypothetical protein